MNELDVVRDETGRELEGSFKHIRVLERRKLFLGKRIQHGVREGREMTHDVHEFEALEWAIEQIDSITKDDE